MQKDDEGRESTQPTPHPDAQSVTARKPQDRLVFVETIYHQTDGQQPRSVESRFSRPIINAEEDPYTRSKKIGVDVWVKVDVGWLESVGIGTILFTNTGEGTIELGIELTDMILPFAFIPPGEAMRLNPVSFLSLMMRGKDKQAKVVFNAYPL
jgi:hypothetical protein